MSKSKPRATVRAPAAAPVAADVDPQALARFVAGLPATTAPQPEDVTTSQDVKTSDPAVRARPRKGGAVRRTTVYLDVEIFEAVRDACHRERRDISAITNAALRAHLGVKTS